MQDKRVHVRMYVGLVGLACCLELDRAIEGGFLGVSFGGEWEELVVIRGAAAKELLAGWMVWRGHSPVSLAVTAL